MINQVKREDIQIRLGYDALIAAFESELGHFDPAIANSLIQKKAPWEQVEEAMNKMAGPHGLMIFYKADQGKITSLHNGIRQCALYTVGNPLIADRILSIDIRASLYVPFRVCIYNSGDRQGAIIGFDRPSSFLASLQNPALKEFGVLLDSKIDGIVKAIRNNYK